MSHVSRSDEVRARIRDLVAEYYAVTWGDPTPFVPGTTRIPYGGRVFGGAARARAAKQ